MARAVAARSSTAVAPSARKRLPRLAREERKAMMINAAIPLLADRGLAMSTRELARGLGVTQALIYKHFGSKQALIEAALAHAFAKRRDGGDRAAVLSDPSQPLAARLAAYYASPPAGGDTRSRIRLFVRAALEGWPMP